VNTYTTVLIRDDTEKQARELRDYISGLLVGRAAEITSGELALVDSAGRQISASVFARAVIARK
jgi:hypothetical protein